jgi:hypothetical protein
VIRHSSFACCFFLSGVRTLKLQEFFRLAIQAGIEADPLVFDVIEKRGLLTGAVCSGFSQIRRQS